LLSVVIAVQQLQATLRYVGSTIIVIIVIAEHIGVDVDGISCSRS